MSATPFPFPPANLHPAPATRRVLRKSSTVGAAIGEAQRQSGSLQLIPLAGIISFLEDRGEGKPESAPPPFFTGDPHGAAVSLHDVLGNAETQPDAVHLIAHGGRPVVLVEHHGQFVLGYARSPVRN